MYDNISFPQSEKPSLDKLFYKLDDGRIWSVIEAKFVDSTPEDAVGWTIDGFGNKSSLDFLLEELAIRHFPKGELKTDAEYATEAREKRNELIAETDYLAMPDYPLDSERKAAVFAYRQALRDVPEQAGFPRQIDWPVKP